jgi:K+-sensing histidine kinase KdpD
MDKELSRIRKLYQAELLDTPAEREFDDIVQLASQLARTPISLITLLDTDRQWIKAKVGLDVEYSDRPTAVCNYTIQGDSLFEVEDLSTDIRFERSSFVVGNPKLRYYAGIPLTTSDGHKLGALCVIDVKSRVKLKDDQVFALNVLARQAMNMIELRVKNKELTAVKAITDRFVQMMERSVGSSMSGLNQLIANISGREVSQESIRRELSELHLATGSADHTLSNIMAWGRLQGGRDSTDMALVLLTALVDECFKGIAAAAQAKGNTLINEVADDARIPLDVAAMRFVLKNLIHNANKYTSNGEIRVRYFTSGGGLNSSLRHYFCVGDTGIGLPVSAVKSFTGIMNLPVRPGTAGETGSGTGLMLVKNVLHHMGAKLHMEGAEGQHCSAIVIL